MKLKKNPDSFIDLLRSKRLYQFYYFLGRNKSNGQYLRICFEMFESSTHFLIILPFRYWHFCTISRLLLALLMLRWFEIFWRLKDLCSAINCLVKLYSRVFCDNLLSLHFFILLIKVYLKKFDSLTNRIFLQR